MKHTCRYRDLFEYAATEMAEMQNQSMDNPALHAAQHRGWYTFIINTAAGGVYTFGQRLSQNRWHRTATADLPQLKGLYLPNCSKWLCSCKHCLFCPAAARLMKKQVGLMSVNAEYCNVDDHMFVPVIDRLYCPLPMSHCCLPWGRVCVDCRQLWLYKLHSEPLQRLRDDDTTG